MNGFIERRVAPSLLAKRSNGATDTTLLDLLYDGFYALYLLGHGAEPENGNQFRSRIVGFLDEFERRARKARFELDEIEAAKYAFCATVDEAVLRSEYRMRAEWERSPLQLLLFGDHLAGEHFFSRLETLRAQGVKRLRALEVFQMCLLLGFQGKYLLTGMEKLEYLIARLGDEIAHMKERLTGFAPHAMRPDQASNTIRGGIPLWLLVGLFVLFGLIAYAAMEVSLAHQVSQRMAGYDKLIKPTAPLATLTVTWP